MYFLEQMMETTTTLLHETERRERVLKWILRVLSIAEKQRMDKKNVIILMLHYEEERRREILEQSCLHHAINKKQKLEYEKSIYCYKEYVQILLKQLEEQEEK